MNTLKPVLSILIPTYNYKIGLIRILSFLHDISKDKYEVIIYDNSPNDDTQKYMEKWIDENNNINLVYQLNIPRTSPAQNWNNLLDSANGQYCLLLHNGEFPDRLDFFNKLIHNLENKKPDFAFVGCILVDPVTSSSYYHLPKVLTSVVIKYYPSYLFQRNVIGPASTVIIKKDVYAKFDENLNWLLDLDSYYRSLEQSKKIEIFKDINIISIINKSDTLTEHLSSTVNQVEIEERKYLAKKYKNIFWNKQSRNVIENSIMFFENIIWKVFAKTYKWTQFNLNYRLNAILKKIWSLNDNN